VESDIGLMTRFIFVPIDVVSGLPLQLPELGHAMVRDVGDEYYILAVTQRELLSLPGTLKT
jgi:hypothetical protein